MVFWLIPVAVGGWIGKAKGRYGAGLILAALFSWLGVLIVSILGSGSRDATLDASSRSNIGVLLGVIGVAGGFVWGFLSYDVLYETSATSAEATVEAVVGDREGLNAVCASEGFLLLQGRNAEVFSCSSGFSSPPEPLGCYAVVDDVVYDVTSQIRLSGVEQGCGGSS